MPVEKRGPQVPTNIEDLGGYRRAEIDAKDAAALQAMQENRRRIEVIEKHVFNAGNGLERRLEARMEAMRVELCAAIEAKVNHVNRNLKDGDSGLLGELEYERGQRSEQHKENKRLAEIAADKVEKWQDDNVKWQRKIERILYMGMGAFALLKMLLPDNVFHIGVK